MDAAPTNSLDITYQPLSLTQAAQRVASYESATEPTYVAMPGASADFDRPILGKDIERIDLPVRIYTIDGHDTKIIVPETFAAELDAVRKFRLGLEGIVTDPTQPLDPSLLRRALPEDFVALLDSLPRADLIYSLILSNEPNPLDPWHRRATGNPDFHSQASTIDGSVTFFMKDVDAYIGDELRHEWSHLASERASSERCAFDAAAAYEGKAYAPRERARANADERWAVLLGEEMLAAEEARFLALTREAPLQSVFLAEALRRHIREADTQDAGRFNAAEIEARLAYVEKEIRPGRVEALTKDARDHADHQNTAACLLLHLGEGRRLNEMSNLTTLDLSGQFGLDLSQLEDNRHLESLDLSGIYISQVPFLTKIPLRTLSLSGNRLLGSALRDVEPIKTLEDLDISSNGINFNGLIRLFKMPHLKRLNVRNIDISAGEIDTLRNAMPNTEILASEPT